MFVVRDTQREAGAQYLAGRVKTSAAAAEIGLRTEIRTHTEVSQKWRLLAQHRQLEIIGQRRASKVRNKYTTLRVLTSITSAARRCNDPDFARIVESLDRELAEQGLLRAQSEQRQRRVAGEETAQAVANKNASKKGGFGGSDRAIISAKSDPMFPQTATGTVNLDGEGKKDAGIKIASELTAWGIKGLWTAKDPGEVKQNLTLAR